MRFVTKGALTSEPLGLRKEKGFRAKEKDASNFWGDV